MRVLLVGTEPEVAEKVNLAARLRWPDATVQVAAELDHGLQAAEEQAPDVVIYESNPESRPADGFILGLRAFSDVPLIVLGPELPEGELDEVRALESGADDYIPRSTGIVCLVARLVAAIRRGRRTDPSANGQPLSTGSLTLDPATYEVFLNDRSLSLTSTEFRLLHLLLSNRGQVVTHEFLSQSLWGDRVESSSLVKKYVQRLRRKLGDDPNNPRWIANVYGVGYRVLISRAEEPQEAGMLVGSAS